MGKSSTAHCNKKLNALLTSMSVLLMSGRNVRWPNRMLTPLVSHSQYADGTDRQTDGRQTVILCFPLLAASVIDV